MTTDNARSSQNLNGITDCNEPGYFWNYLQSSSAQAQHGVSAKKCSTIKTNKTDCKPFNDYNWNEDKQCCEYIGILQLEES